MKFRPQFWPTVFTVPAVLLMLGLGTWQVERLKWKEGLIAERVAGVRAPAVTLPTTLADAQGLEFRHVRADGVFRHDAELYVAATADSGVRGFHVVTPLLLDDGRVLLVNRGFVRDDLKDPATRAEGQVQGRVAVEGLLRLAPERKPSWLLPENSPERNYWFYVDPAAMARAKGLGEVLPFYVDAGPTPNPGGWPKGGVTRIELPNNHLQYAVTWYLLAATLVVIYVVYHRRPNVLQP